ncbi:MAG: RHS repeat-associated core domain-containing protein, partial [Terrimicrobiaceae bacterium]
RGVTFSHDYDDFRRLESISAAGTLPEQNQSIAWTYDNQGIPETITQTGGGQPDSTITHTITPYGQIGNEAVAFDGGTTSFSQTWNGAGRRAALGAGPGFDYGFNAAGQLTSVSVAGNSYNSSFNTAGLLSSRSNPFRTQTITDRDGAGRILTQAVTSGSATPLSETQIWRADSTLDSYAANRTGENAWDESRSFGYDARGQMLSESYAPGPDNTATLNYTFSANKLGIRTNAQVGTGGNTNWFINATTVNSLARITALNENTGTRAVSASGEAFGAASVALEVDGVPGPVATHPGWQDATGAWTANLTLTAGSHTLTARGVHPSGWLSDPATSTFTVTGIPQTVSQGFDNMGNMISRTWSGGKDQTLIWDAFGRLVKVVQTGVEPFTWTAAYDGLGRRLRTTHTPSGGSAFVVNSSFDPQVEFLEVGVDMNGAQNWRVNGVDLNGAFGRLNGTGGLEAVITPDGTTGTINDVFGNMVASVVVNSAVTWSPTKIGSYGPLPQYAAKTLESGASLIETSTWRTRRADPTGLTNLGARHYDKDSGSFISADPLGHATSWSLYDFASGDGVNNFDADGRISTGISSGWNGAQASNSPDSWAYALGQAVGAGVSGAGMGLSQGLDNINNIVTYGLYDNLGWSDSASNTGWEHDLSRSFATIPRDVATGAAIGSALNVVTRTTSNVITSMTSTATLTRGTSIPVAQVVPPRLALPAPVGTNPYPSGVPLNAGPAPSGLVVEMAMSPGQPITRPGGFATLDTITDVAYARNQLAIIPEFKPHIGYVQRYQITPGTQIQWGPVGPQTSEGILYPGGGTQIQILVSPAQRSSVLTPVGPARPIQ